MRTRPIPTLTDDELDHLVQSIHTAPGDSCWTFAYVRGPKAGQPYTTRPRLTLHRDGRQVGADVSRLVFANYYEGADLDGMTVEHTCGRGEHGCVSPAHMVAMTLGENSVAPSSNSVAARHKRQTRCKRGHDLADPAVLYVWTDDRGRAHRKCRACRAVRKAAAK